MQFGLSLILFPKKIAIKIRIKLFVVAVIIIKFDTACQSDRKKVMKHEMGEQEEFSIQELDSSVAFVRLGMRMNWEE